MPTLDRNNATSSSRKRLDRYQALLLPLMIGCAVTILAFAFAKLGSEVAEGDTRIFDMALLARAQSFRAAYPWLAEVMRDLSGLGSTVVLSIFTVATVGYLSLVHAKITALLVATSVISGTVLVSVFKAAFGRLRPDAAYAELVVSGLSFPSGHASMSAIVFLTIGTLIASTRSHLPQRIYILLIAALMTLLVGLSRVALGVHWATDVLGGWALGSAWSIFWLLLVRYISKQRGSKVP